MFNRIEIVASWLWRSLRGREGLWAKPYKINLHADKHIMYFNNFKYFNSFPITMQTLFINMSSIISWMGKIGTSLMVNTLDFAKMQHVNKMNETRYQHLFQGQKPLDPKLNVSFSETNKIKNLQRILKASNRFYQIFNISVKTRTIIKMLNIKNLKWHPLLIYKKLTPISRICFLIMIDFALHNDKENRRHKVFSQNIH